jgi:hypothetical protein
VSNEEQIPYEPGQGKLTEKEIAAANAALEVHGFFRQMEGACYRAAMFLRLYLKETHNIDGQVMVGYVNDGEGPVYPSHAWYEYEGKPTDIALAYPVDSSQTPPGPVLIQGVTIEPGHPYTYHETVPEIGQQFIEQYKTHPMVAQIVREQGQSHAEAFACANDDGLARAYLDRAPDGWTYQRIVEFIKDRQLEEQS